MLRLFLALVLLIFATPSWAVEKKGNITESDMAAAAGYASWTTTFGQPDLAFIAADEGHTALLMEFLGDGETVDNWTRMVTINLIGLPPESAAQRKEIATYIETFRKRLESLKQGAGLTADIKEFTVPSATAEPQYAIYHFVIGKQTPDEHNAGIIFPMNGAAVNFQVQRRNGKAIEKEEMDLLRGQLQNLMNANAPAAATTIETPKEK